METLEETLEDKKIWRQIKIEKNILNYFKTKGGKKLNMIQRLLHNTFFIRINEHVTSTDRLMSAETIQSFFPRQE